MRSALDCMPAEIYNFEVKDMIRREGEDGKGFVKGLHEEGRGEDDMLVIYRQWVGGISGHRRMETRIWIEART